MPPGQPMAGPVVVDVGKRAAVQVAVGGAVAGGIGLIPLIAAVTGGINGPAVAYVIAVVIGLGFTGIGVLALLNWKKASRPRKLVLDPHGVTWDDPQGQPWAVRWEELSGVAISRTKERAVQVSDAAARRVLVRLDLFPADPGFRQRHPEMEHLWEFHRVRNGYRLPLGSNPGFIAPIDHGMRLFRPQIYGGVRDEGISVGLV